MLCHGMVCVVGRMRDLILQLSKSSIYSTKPCKSMNRYFFGTFLVQSFAPCTETFQISLIPSSFCAYCTLYSVRLACVFLAYLLL
ncbi:hypothetical protein CBI35_23340 [Pantoea sp. AV62]|nr:hypothetical protein CBI35_23340 [Pantoea sp. AV62]